MDELGNLWLIVCSSAGYGGIILSAYTTPTLEIYTDPVGSPYMI